MSIDNIPLSGILCQQLYSTTLIGGATMQAGESQLHPKKKIEYLGLNQKNILFLINDAENKYLPEDQMQVMANLLTACHLTMEDVALVNYAHDPSGTYTDFTEQLGCKKLLIFGVSARDLKLPFHVPDFQIQSFQEQVYLFSPPFGELANDPSIKSKLWVCLKKLFSF